MNLLKDLGGAYGFATSIQLESKAGTKDGWSHRVIAARETRHAVIEISRDLDVTTLEQASETLDARKNEAKSEFRRILSELRAAPSVLWGDESYVLVSVVDPRLQSQSTQRIREVFNALCGDVLDEADALVLWDATGDVFIPRATGGVCIVQGAESPRSYRDLLLYALFLKTAYRRFTHRSSILSRAAVNASPRQIHAVASNIRTLQADYTRFLGHFDIDEQEISAHVRVQEQFRQIAHAIDLDRQRRETNYEVERLGDLVQSLTSEIRYRADTRTQHILAVVGVLALGDFFHGVASDIATIGWEAAFAPAVGVVAVLASLGATTLLALKPKRPQILLPPESDDPQ